MKQNSFQSDTKLDQHTHLLRSRSLQSSKAPSFDDRLVINICGDRYETLRATLEHYPDTLLGNAKRRKYYFDSVHQEYFFDRHRACFQAILYYYQSRGRLRRPDYIPLDVFLDEVTFFQLGKEALDQVRKEENLSEMKKVRLPKNRLRRWLWATMEYPNYSSLAKVVNALSLLMILISTITLAVETLPQYVHMNGFDCRKQQDLLTTTLDPTDTDNLTSPTEFYTCKWSFASPFIVVQLTCVAAFTVELLLRLISTPSLADFARNPMNWIDVFAVLPFFVSMAIRLAGISGRIGWVTHIGLRLLRVLRLARAFKFCRAMKSIKSLRVLTTTIQQSLLDFTAIIIILTMLGFLFGSAAYYAENEANPAAFDSIPKATYWGIVTITSVGYGDVTPVTPIGRIIGCLCALFGVTTIGMLVSIMVDRYQRVYAQKLYFHEEVIDFDDYSDDDNEDLESKRSRCTTESHCESTNEELNARAKRTAWHACSSLRVPLTVESSFEEEQEADTMGKGARVPANPSQPGSNDEMVRDALQTIEHC